MQKFVLLCLLGACASAPQLRPHEMAAGRAVARAWSEKGLPPPTMRKRCAIDEFEVRVTTTAEAYKALCPTANPWKSAGCLSWESSAHWFFWRDRPLVVVSPKHYSEPTIVVHELLHAYTQCAELRINPWDPGDREHSDPRVWTAAGGADAVQTRADALCKEMP